MTALGHATLITTEKKKLKKIDLQYVKSSDSGKYANLGGILKPGNLPQGHLFLLSEPQSKNEISIVDESRTVRSSTIQVRLQEQKRKCYFFLIKLIF